MELMQMSSEPRSDFAPSNSPAPWFKKRITVILIGAALILALVAFIVAGYFTGTSGYRHTGDTLESVELEAPKKVLPNIKWEGVCPQKTSKCPVSFRGIPPLLVISLDGFHPDYLKRGFTPTLKNIAQCGVKADFMYPVFPSKTFPNHYSQVTGLNPPSHGIIDNSMYDPFTRKLFKVGKPETLESFWWEKEPIWITAEKQGKKAACFFWPGSDIKINGSLPSYFKKYSSKITFEARVDQILEWLDLSPESRPSFLTLYVNQPDNAAHFYGVNSKQTNDALAKVDQMIRRLYSGLQQRNLINCVNVVIISDHGMSDISCKRVVDIQDYMNVSDLYATMGPFGRLRPKGRRNTTAVNEVISKLRCRSNHMRVYAKEQLPVRMHYADNTRIEPIFLDIDAGWTVVSKKVKPGDEICTGGAHGYDNFFPDMRAFFVASGPSFKTNLTIRPFINTELYELFTELIHVVPQPNNGTRGSLHHILKSPPPLPPQFEPDAPTTGDIPKDEMEYNFRITASNCSCAQPHKQVEVKNVNEIHHLYLPFGVPYSFQDNSTLRLLYNKDYITAFDLKFRLPMWTAFTLSGQKNISKFEDVCWMGDARIPINDVPQCGEYNTSFVKNQYILQRPLYPPEFSNASVRDEATFVTNSVPKSMNHSKILEKKLNQILSQWAREQGQLNVIMGPAFDLHATGMRPAVGNIRKYGKLGPIIVPTHIFVVATWCSTKAIPLKDCSPSKLEAHGFLLPNYPYTQNCESAASVIGKNVARVVDVENLTGLSFYTGLPIYDAIRLRTMMPERSIS
ncbi:ectonucleotide pyrophosphatase/phosphodiesterase family member 3-like isoform X2 [Stegodyphus dumicola]|uniref:ectonucleotide pyrophosphatase/phosphodiesterase family member 3-like isoform X2 n=1 Tax=Stegodyphus dumicola TaxID=202533 RepID=UPI0015B158C6|nr:ectonucleotide pyrophosphatase/phosphodiesterase family member 3-like isoform X2 [Stegodyphus dumicola]